VERMQKQQRNDRNMGVIREHFRECSLKAEKIESFFLL